MTLTSPVAPSATAEGADATLDAEATRQLDSTIARLAGSENSFGALSVADRARLVDRLHASVSAASAEWVRAASRIKKLEPDSPYVGEEWISGPYAVLASLAVLHSALTAIAAGKSPLAGKKFGRAPGNRVTVPVLPGSVKESILFNGFRAEVWMPPGTSEETTKARAGLGELDPTKTGGVGLVLGAGNITSIPPLDVLYELFANNRISLLKLNPVLADMEAVYRAALAPLIEAGLLEIVQGGGAVGSYLAHHAGISHVHITGSSATHDVVVWGPGQPGRDRRKANTPLLQKPITSELGGVSPIILVPGKWSKADLRYQAEHVATQRLHNGGYNCIAGQIVVLSSDWAQKDAFLVELRAALDRAPVRAPWYPGSDDRVAAAAKAHPTASRHASDTRLLVEITADGDASTIETTEYFSPVLGVVQLPGTGLDFLASAVTTVNDDFRGQRAHRSCYEVAAGRRVPGPDCVAAVRHDRNQYLDRLRLPDRWRALGRIPGGHADRRAERHRGRAQCAAHRLARAHGGLRALPPVPAFVRGWRGCPVPEAAVVRHCPLGSGNRSEPRQLRQETLMAEDARRLRGCIPGIASRGQ